VVNSVAMALSLQNMHETMILEGTVTEGGLGDSPITVIARWSSDSPEGLT